MNIIRKYKLYLLKYNTLTKKELNNLNIIFKSIKYSKENFEQINYIYNNLFNLKKVKSHHNNIFFLKNQNVIFEYYFISRYFYMDSDLWEDFVNKFKYKNDEVNSLIKKLAEEIYKLNNVIVMYGIP